MPSLQYCIGPEHSTNNGFLYEFFDGNVILQCFVSAEKTFVFNNASVMVLPHYKHGSLLVCIYTHIH